MKAAEVDAIILGCTHFPFLRKQIQLLVEDGIRIIDPAEALTAESDGVLKRFFKKTAGINVEPLFGQDFALNTEFYVTGAIDQFNLAAGKCLGQQMTATNMLSLHELAGAHARSFLEQAAIAARSASATSSTTHSVPQAATT
jgi:glutamate racemase